VRGGETRKKTALFPHPMRTQRELYGVARSRFQIHPPQQVVEARVVAEGVVAQMGAVMDYDLNDPYHLL
jgi:hypothetical protein